MRNCFIHELELENDRGAVETSFLFFIADQNCIPLSLITTFFTSIFIFNGKCKVFHFPEISLVTLQSLETDWRFCCSVPLSLAGEKVRFRAENSEIRESIIVLLKDNLIVKITSDF